MEVKLFYGSTTGNTEKVAKKIADAMKGKIAEVVDIKKASVDDFDFCDGYILGLSTVDEGLLQEDWRRFWDNMEDIDFDGKPVAIFGLGDQVKYGKWFVSAMGEVYDKVTELGANVVGAWPTDGYTYDDTTAVRDGKFVGLVIDEDNQADKTDARIATWVGQIGSAFS
ncbi:MAG: flavodoxin [Fimbriimonadaceae bacterium]|nr:flavodoxin [Fimbriimonadaceae bacterium]